VFWKCWKSKFEFDKNKCRQVDGCVDAVTITDNFAKYFESTYSCNNPGRAHILKNEYLEMRCNYSGLPLGDIKTLNTEMVSKIILNLKRGKAPGIDGLMAEHLQYCHPIISVILSKLFQLIMLTQYVPSGFKLSYIVPIPKVKDTLSTALKCDNFRGIAISPILSKVFEHCILERYQSFLYSNNNQYGFKKGVSCNHAIFAVRNIVDSFVSKGSTVNLCAIDIAKAFDKVNHYALYMKLMKRRIPVVLLNVIINLFSGCATCIKWDGLYSATFNIDFGVRQGSVLSPTLFAVYINDIISSFHITKGCSIILYADDILLLSPSITELERLLHCCERELNYLDMNINFNKSSCLRIGPRHDVTCANVVSLNGSVIAWTTEMRYLGVHIISSRLFKCSLVNAKRSFYRGANAIFGKIGRLASEEVVLQLIKSKCIPILLYGLEPFDLSSRELKSLDFVINRFFMKLFRTTNMEIIQSCQYYFCFDLPSVMLQKRTARFRGKYSEYVAIT